MSNVIETNRVPNGLASTSETNHNGKRGKQILTLEGQAILELTARRSNLNSLHDNGVPRYPADTFKVTDESQEAAVITHSGQIYTGPDIETIIATSGLKKDPSRVNWHTGRLQRGAITESFTTGEVGKLKTGETILFIRTNASPSADNSELIDPETGKLQQKLRLGNLKGARVFTHTTPTQKSLPEI